MNEEFAIQLKTVLDQSSINTVKEQISDLKKTMEQQMNVAVSPAARASGNASATTSRSAAPKMSQDLKEAYDELKLWETELAYVQQMMKIDTSPLSLEKWEIKLQNVKARIDEVKTAIEEMEKDAGGEPQGLSLLNMSTIVIQQNMKGAVKQAGKLALALIGIRGIYGSIHKATSTWLSQNKEIQEKLNGAWYALGSLFAPAIEALVNLFVRLVSLVDALAKALGFAGVNMSKYGKAAGGAAKKQKALMSIDEINNIQDQNGGGGGGGGFELDPISEKQLQIFKAISALVAGIAAGLLAWKIGGQFIEDLGDLFKFSVGIGLAVGGVTYAIMNLLSYLNDPSWANFGGIITGIGVAIFGIGLAIGSVPAMIAGAITAVLGLLAMFWPQIKQFLDNVIAGAGDLFNMIHEKITTGGPWIAMIVGTMIETVILTFQGAVIFIRDLFDDLFNGVKKILDGIIELFRGNFSGGLSLICQGILQLFSGLLNAVWNTVTSTLNVIFNAVVNIANKIGDSVSTKVKDILNKYVIDPLNKLIGWINGKLNFEYGGLNIAGVQIIDPFSINLGNLKTIPLLETGTNYVPNDMLAMLHQGEAVVPKKFNNGDMYGQVSEEELNLLSSINEQLIELNRKDTTINLDGTNIAERINNKIQDITYRNGERVFAVAR